MRHAQLHAQTRTRENRRSLAVEAARLISEEGIRDFHQAKLKAAQRLGIDDTRALPRNSEIEEALREHQRIFRGDSQPLQLRERREAALRAMDFLERFEPRLVGPVLDGTADEHAAVSLHLFSDEPEAVHRFLDEHGVPFEERSRQLRLDRDRSTEVPVLLFSAEELGFDLSVLPHDALRQPPLDRVDARPMRRASRAALETLLAEEDIAAFEAAGG